MTERVKKRIRWSLAGASLAVLVVALWAGLRSEGAIAPGRDVTTIRFWNPFAGPDGRAMLALVRRFNEANPDCNVIMQRMDWGPYYNKLFVAGLGGRGPEVFIVHEDVIRRFERAGSVRAVDDLTGPGGVDAADIDPNVWAATEEGGKHWGIPLDVHPMGMWYNKAMFRAAGIVDAKGEAKPPTNREEFLADIKKLKQADHWGYMYTWQRTNLYTLVRQFGGGLWDEKEGRPTFERPENLEALAFARSLVADGLVPSPQNFDSWVGFLQGRVGIAFEGIYKLDDLRRQKDLDWGAAPVPVLGSKPAVWVDSHNLCLKAGLAGKELEVAKRFVRFLSDNSLDWAQGGQVPVRRSLRETDRFKGMYAQAEFAKQIPYGVYMPAVPFIFELQSEFDFAVEQALRGSLTPKQAMAVAQERVEVAAERYRAGATAVAKGER